MAGERYLISRIKQIEENIRLIEEAELDDTTRDEIIERNRTLRKYYTRKLRNLKWNFLLNGNKVEDYLESKLN